MELSDFIADLVSGLARLELADSVDLQTEAFTVKGRVHLRGKGFLEVYFNERTQTLAVAWIQNEKRGWGIDRDNMRGWHRHSIENPEDHQPISAMSVSEILRELESLWQHH